MKLDFAALADRYEHEPKMRATVEHNVGVLKCIHGGLRMAEQNAIQFDPRVEYWRPPERRIAIAYLADRWTSRCAPPEAARELALAVTRHMERARSDGVVTYLGVDPQEIARVLPAIAEHAARLGPVPAWKELRSTYGRLPETAAEHLSAFVSEIDPAGAAWDWTYGNRLPWFAYLGAEHLAAVELRRRFFFGFANLWTTTNAFKSGGALSFASVLQNTPASDLIGYASRWAAGQSPLETRFLTLGKDDTEPEDRAQYSVVIEVHGFLNLHRAPFYNNRADIYADWFDVRNATTPYDLISAVGAVTCAWLNENVGAVPRLAMLFKKLQSAPIRESVEFERIDSTRAARRVADMGQKLADDVLRADLETLARGALDALSERDSAAAALHLLIDSEVYRVTSAPPPPVTQTPVLSPPGDNPVDTHPIPLTAAAEPLRLPEGLRPAGELALSYLRAGLHVLFAGKPGTGKTTLAQFVAAAWNRSLTSLPAELPISDAPLTTVGNSAWSPFHTIGGLIPGPNGSYQPNAGIFIDPQSATGHEWRLRNVAIVLDEMNRADLDRCVGDLYPLLSGSVGSVAPAGMPGVQQIVGSPRFRVLATMNDSTLDDVVFPISDGLARRFQRIELAGASLSDVKEFLVTDSSASPSARYVAAVGAATDFFEVVRDLKKLTMTDVERLPFGVGYLALLRAWVAGTLELPISATQPTEQEQARQLVAGCFRTLGSARAWSDVLDAYEKLA